MTRGRVDELIYIWQWVKVFWACLIEIRVIYTHAPFFIAFFLTRTALAIHLENWNSLIKPASSSLSNSLSIACCISMKRPAFLFQREGIRLNVEPAERYVLWVSQYVVWIPRKMVGVISERFYHIIPY